MSEGPRRGGEDLEKGHTGQRAWGLGCPERQFKKKGEAIIRTNQTTTEKTVHPMTNPALGRKETAQRGMGAKFRSGVLSGVLTGLLALLLWPTAALAIDGNALPDAVFANFTPQRNRVCLLNVFTGFTCSDVSTDTNTSRSVALSPSRPCNSSVTMLAGLRLAVDALTTSQTTKDTLTGVLDRVQFKLDKGRPEKARNRMVGFQKRVARLPNPDKTLAMDLIVLSEANALLCAGHNVLTGIPVP